MCAYAKMVVLKSLTNRYLWQNCFQMGDRNQFTGPHVFLLFLRWYRVSANVALLFSEEIREDKG
jgi:hypothetical protein